MKNTTTTVSPQQSTRCFAQEGTTYYSLLVIIAFLAVCINLGVIFTMATNRYLRTKRNAFLASLTVSDLLTGLVTIPLHVLCNCYHKSVGTLYLVQVVCFRFIAISTMLNIFMITVERYIGILYPIRYTVILTKTRTVILLSCTWATSISSALVSYSWLVVSNPSSANTLRREEKPERVYFIFAFVLFFLLPLAVMVVMYTRMFRTISSARKSASKTRMYFTIVPIKDSEVQSCYGSVGNMPRRERSRSHGTFGEHLDAQDGLVTNQRLRSKSFLSPPVVMHCSSNVSLGSRIASGSSVLKDQKDNETVFPSDKNPITNRVSLVRKFSDACGIAASKLRILRQGNDEDHWRQAGVIRERRVLIIFAAMLSFFVFSWLSWYIMLFNIVRMIRVPAIILDCFDILRFSVSFFNPILYTFFKKDFRVGLARSIRRKKYRQVKEKELETKMLKS